MAIDFPNAPSVGQVYQAPSGASWQWTGTLWTAVSSGVISGAPNKLINPFMEIDQANEGAAVTGSNFPVDGVYSNVNVGTVTSQRSTNAPTGYPNSVVATQTATGAVVAGSIVSLYRKIEADDLVDTGFGTSAAQTLSLTIWARASIAGTYCAALRNGTGDRSYVFNLVISAANTWQQFNQIIPGDTGGTWVTKGNGQGAILDAVAVCGSTYQTSTLNTWQAGTFIASNTISNTMAGTLNATFQLGPCGLWVAPAPQPLLRTSFHAELARCQRYYEKSYDIGTAPGTVTQNGSSVITAGSTPVTTQTTIYFKVSKRALGTGTFYSPATGAVGKARDYVNNVDVNLTVGSNGMNAVSWYALPSAGAPNLATQWVVDARL